MAAHPPRYPHLSRFTQPFAEHHFADSGTTRLSVNWLAKNRVSVSSATLNPDSQPVPTTASISPVTKTAGNADSTLTVDATNSVDGVSRLADVRSSLCDLEDAFVAEQDRHGIPFSVSRYDIGKVE